MPTVPHTNMKGMNILMALSVAANTSVVTATVLPRPLLSVVCICLPSSVSCAWDTGMDQPSTWAGGRYHDCTCISFKIHVLGKILKNHTQNENNS